MKKSEIEEMINGIDDRYISEAIQEHKLNKGRIRFNRIAAAAAVVILTLGIGTSVLAATNSQFSHWIKTFSIFQKDYQGNKGVEVKPKSKEYTESDITEKETKWYLVMNNIPQGYSCSKEDSSVYYGKEGDTDYFTIAYFHLQADFKNILPGSKNIEGYDGDKATAYIATSQNENRMWIKLKDIDYMVEIRDRNKVLTLEELKKMVDGVDVTRMKSETKYETLEWTKKLADSYQEWLKTIE